MFNQDPTSFTATSTPSGATVEATALATNEAVTRVTPATFELDKGSDCASTSPMA